jgi:Protein of unknown function (DUF2934)
MSAGLNFTGASFVTERLVDVMNDKKTVLHTFPVALKASGSNESDTEFEEKALSAAAHSQLVPTDELEGLSARMHISRSGTMTPYGDSHDVLMETKTDLDRIVRERAYHLWEQEGRQEGRSDEYWHHAHEQRLRERAYRLWEQEGRPAGQADRHYCGTCGFEES